MRGIGLVYGHPDPLPRSAWRRVLAVLRFAEARTKVRWRGERESGKRAKLSEGSTAESANAVLWWELLLLLLHLNGLTTLIFDYTLDYTRSAGRMRA